MPVLHISRVHGDAAECLSLLQSYALEFAISTWMGDRLLDFVGDQAHVSIPMTPRGRGNKLTTLIFKIL